MKLEPDRYLVRKRDRETGIFYYLRRIPQDVLQLVRAESGNPDLTTHRTSLKTRDRVEARLRRDAMEAADDAYWASLIAGPNGKERARYQSAKALAKTRGFRFRSLADLLDEGNDREILDRVFGLDKAMATGASERRAVEALLGTVEPPAYTLRSLADTYFDQITGSLRDTKDEPQYRVWRSTRERALATLASVVGWDRALNSLEREDGLALRAHYKARIDAGEIKVTTADKSMGIVAKIWSDFHEHIGQPQAANPFVKLQIARSRPGTRMLKEKDSYPPFSAKWIEERILDHKILAKLNPEARAIICMLVETGARESEICNLRPDDIVLDHPVPHIHIRCTDEREVKSSSSQRRIPLIGVALEAARKHPDGFPRYRGTRSFSGVASKWLRVNGLKETDRHVIYSLRHAFKDRMIAHGVDEELREVLMGHEVGHIVYGAQGSLEDRLKAIEGMALSNDSEVVELTGCGW